MQGNTTYKYKGSDGTFIENGIMIGANEPYTTNHSSYGELLLERLRATPEFVGQVNGVTGKEETFGEMTEKSVKCAMWLKEHDVKPGDIIGICTHNQMDMYVPCFASLYIGAVFNPWWNVGITREVTRHFLTLTRPKILFADEASAGLVAEVAKELDLPLKVLVFGNLPGLESLDDILASQDTKKVSEFRCTKLLTLDEPAVILYTSGTTGLPKGALHSHRSLFGNVKTFHAMGGIKETTRQPIITIIFSPLAWVTGILCMLMGVVERDTKVIYPEFQEESTFQLIEKFKISWTFLGMSPAIRLQKSAAISNYDLSSLKYIFVGGSALKEKPFKAITASFPGAKVLQAYGTTELCGTVLEQDADNLKTGSCGKVVRNVSLKVIDPESGAVLGPKQMGEACFESPFRMIGYHKNPEATKEAIDAEGWVHTGDLVLYDEEGNVFVSDRIKEMIKHKGHQVSPALIERVLQAHPEVSEVAVVGVPHTIDDELPIAFVARTPKAQVTKEELQKLVADELPDYMKLRGGVEFLTELPHTPSGKVSRADLRRMAQSMKTQ